MKFTLLSVLLAGITLTAIPTQVVLADDTTSTSTPPAANQGAPGSGMMHMLEQLNLTDDQKQKIQDIRSKVSDHEQRRAQIMAVLTPDQQAKLKQLRADAKDHPQSGSGGSSADSN